MSNSLQYLIFATLVSRKDRKLIIGEIVICYNSLDESVSFLTGDNIFHYEIFKQIADSSQIHQMELCFLIFCYITHPLNLL